MKIIIINPDEYQGINSLFLPSYDTCLKQNHLRLNMFRLIIEAHY